MRPLKLPCYFSTIKIPFLFCFQKSHTNSYHFHFSTVKCTVMFIMVINWDGVMVHDMTPLVSQWLCTKLNHGGNNGQPC